MTDKFTRHFGQKFRGCYRSRTRSNSSQALFTSPRRVPSSLLLLVVLGYSIILGLDIEPDPFLRRLYIWDQILGLTSSNAAWTQGINWPPHLSLQEVEFNLHISLNFANLTNWIPSYFPKFKNKNRAWSALKKKNPKFNYKTFLFFFFFSYY